MLAASVTRPVTLCPVGPTEAAGSAWFEVVVAPAATEIPGAAVHVAAPPFHMLPSPELAGGVTMYL